MPARKLFRSLAVFSIIVLSALSCSQKKPEFSPQQLAIFNLFSTEADMFYKSGGYVSLKKAFAIYEDQQTFPAFQNRTLRNLVKTALLLAIRENELSIIGDKYLTKALELIDSFPVLSEFSSYAAIVFFSQRRGAGILRRGPGIPQGKSQGQYDRDEYYQWVNKNFVSLNADLKDKAESEEFYAYFYLTFKASFHYNIKEEDTFTRYLDIFPNSPLIQYKLSVFPKFDQKRMETLLQNDPDFFEAHFFLGDMSLKLGNTLTAEKSLLKAYEKIPTSISLLTLITKIHFFLEEFDECLEYNEKILFITPEYRDSLLGKAICLGYLGRHEEALDILHTLIDMGIYLMGESHYWLAWNLHELGQFKPAWENIKRALNYLIGHFEVHSLAGVIAFDMSNIEASEEQFKKALWINKGDCEASFYMGKIFSLRSNWEQSGIHFENAALCNAGMERALQEKIKELKDSAFTPSRKEKHIMKKKILMKKVQVTKATSYYNAAAVYFNAGQGKKALELAQNARDSKTLKSKVEELINKIKEKNKLEYSRVEVAVAARQWPVKLY